jgi:hypothetical protein
MSGSGSNPTPAGVSVSCRDESGSLTWVDLTRKQAARIAEMLTASVSVAL